MIGSLKAASVDVGGFKFAEAQLHLTLPASLVFLILNVFFDRPHAIEIEEDIWADSYFIDPETVFALSYEKVLDSVLKDLLHSRGSFIYGEFVDLVVQSSSKFGGNRRSQAAPAQAGVRTKSRRRSGKRAKTTGSEHFGHGTQSRLQPILPHQPKTRGQKCGHQEAASGFLLFLYKAEVGFRRC